MVTDRQRESGSASQAGSSGAGPPGPGVGHADSRQPAAAEESRTGDPLIDAIREGVSLGDMAEQLAGGSLARLGEIFETCCDQRTLRNLLRMEQYERAFRLERLKREATDRLFEMSQGEIVPDGTVESVRELDFQRRAIVSFLRLNAFPSAREVREDQRIASPSEASPMPNWSARALVNDMASESGRGSDAGTAKEPEAREPRDKGGSPIVDIAATPGVAPISPVASNGEVQAAMGARPRNGAAVRSDHLKNAKGSRDVPPSQGMQPSRVQLTGAGGGGSFLRGVNDPGVLGMGKPTVLGFDHPP